MSKKSRSQKTKFYIYVRDGWYLTYEFGKFMPLKPSVVLLEFPNGETSYIRNIPAPNKEMKPATNEEIWFIKLSAIDGKNLEQWLT